MFFHALVNLHFFFWFGTILFSFAFSFDRPSGSRWDFVGSRLLTCVIPEAGAVEFAHVEVEANDGKHEDGKEE